MSEWAPIAIDGACIIFWKSFIDLAQYAAESCLGTDRRSARSPLVPRFERACGGGADCRRTLPVPNQRSDLPCPSAWRSWSSTSLEEMVKMIQLIPQDCVFESFFEKVEDLVFQFMSKVWGSLRTLHQRTYNSSWSCRSSMFRFSRSRGKSPRACRPVHRNSSHRPGKS